MYKVTHQNETAFINTLEGGKKYLAMGYEVRDDETNILLTTEEDLEKYNPMQTIYATYSTSKED
jgi:hypothetical protein